MLEGENFFNNVKKYDDEGAKGSRKESEIIAKGVNRKFNEPWNIKITMTGETFDELFKFLREIGYSTLFKFTEKEIKIYIIDPAGTHMSLVIIDKTEVAEYMGVNNNKAQEHTVNGHISNEHISHEHVIYVDTDVIEDMSLNVKFPVEIFFDTAEKKKMYIVNGKEMVSRRLNSTDNQDNTLGTCENYENKLMNQWIKNENVFRITVGHIGLKNAIVSLEKKKKTDIKLTTVEFRKNEIEFIVEDDVRRSSAIMYGEDIVIGGTRDVNNIYTLEHITKFGKLKLTNNVNLYVNDNFPLIMETKFGAGKIVLYYMIAPRVDND